MALQIVQTLKTASTGAQAGSTSSCTITFPFSTASAGDNHWFFNDSNATY
jgi:hypothetical protein